MNFGLENDNSLFNQKHFPEVAELASRLKIHCDFPIKEFSKYVYDNHLRSQTLINNLNKVNKEWRKCEI